MSIPPSRLFGQRLPTPLLSSWLRRARRHAIKTLNMSRSRVAKALHQLVFHPVRVDPRIGTVAALTSLSDHRVDPVAPGSLRFALVVAGDRPGVTFEAGQDYYGDAAAEVMLSEVAAAAQTAAVR